MLRILAHASFLASAVALASPLAFAQPIPSPSAPPSPTAFDPTGTWRLTLGQSTVSGSYSAGTATTKTLSTDDVQRLVPDFPTTQEVLLTFDPRTRSVTGTDTEGMRPESFQLDSSLSGQKDLGVVQTVPVNSGCQVVITERDSVHFTDSDHVTFTASRSDQLQTRSGASQTCADYLKQVMATPNGPDSDPLIAAGLQSGAIDPARATQLTHVDLTSTYVGQREPLPSPTASPSASPSPAPTVTPLAVAFFHY